MLVFFVHGVATRDVKYADTLKTLIREQCLARKQPAPYSYSSFWGNALSDVSRMWHQIHQSLHEFKAENPQSDLQEIFRYQAFREGLFSEFVGDMFTYLNQQRGYEIRKLIAQQLIAFIKEHPQETDLHIVAHSLGSVILWDVLFSNRFQAKDPALYIRSLIHGFDSSQNRKVRLKSITTMGSPILFFNTMLGIDPATVSAFAQKQENPLRWLNVLHASDIIAYPLKASLPVEPAYCQIHDVHISTDVNLPGKIARVAGQMELAMALEVGTAHTGYWNCSSTAQFVATHLLGKQWHSSASMLQSTIDLLEKIPGMTSDKIKLHFKQ